MTFMDGKILTLIIPGKAACFLHFNLSSYLLCNLSSNSGASNNPLERSHGYTDVVTAESFSLHLFITEPHEVEDQAHLVLKKSTTSHGTKLVDGRRKLDLHPSF